MFPYEQMEARAQQKMDRYRAEARRHRQVRGDEREGHGLPGRLWRGVKGGLGRSGLGRIGSVLSGKESGPILPAT